MYIKQLTNNQFEIITEDARYLQSYDSVVCKIDSDNRVSLGADYRYSKTTMKYLIQFLGVDSIKYVDREVDAGNWPIDESLRISDKEKYIKEVKKIVETDKTNYDDINLADLFNELKTLVKDL